MAFKKGQSGNPGGRSKAEFDLIALAKKHAPQAFNNILAIANADHPDIKTKMRANEIVMDRAYGKAPQAVNVSGELSHTVTVKVNLKDVPK